MGVGGEQIKRLSGVRSLALHLPYFSALLTVSALASMGNEGLQVAGRSRLWPSSPITDSCAVCSPYWLLLLASSAMNSDSFSLSAHSTVMFTLSLFAVAVMVAGIFPHLAARPLSLSSIFSVLWGWMFWYAIDLGAGYFSLE